MHAVAAAGGKARAVLPHTITSSTVADLNFDLQSADYSYNYVTWTGGEDAYQTCDLSERGATYVGTCTAAVKCNTTLTRNTVDTSLTDVSYSCSDNSTSSACAATCDQQDWCKALCYCASNCTSTQVCCCCVLTAGVCVKPGQAVKIVASMTCRS